MKTSPQRELCGEFFLPINYLISASKNLILNSAE